MNLDILLAKAELFEKLAINVDEVKKIIKASLEKVFKAYPSIMDGFLYVSNVNLQLSDNLVNFTINLDVARGELLLKNKSQRDTIIKSIVREDLKNILGTDLTVVITENLV